MLTLAQALPQDPVVKLADGNKYTFSEFHLNAQAAVQDKYDVSFTASQEPSAATGGSNPGDLGAFLAKNSMKPDVLRFIAWQLLRKYQRDLTEEDVGYLITMENMTDVLQAVSMSIVNSMPLPADKKKELMVSLEEKVTQAKVLLSQTTGV